MSTSLDLGGASRLSCPVARRSAHVLPATIDRASGHATIAMLARLHLTYWWRHGRILSLDRPRLFTELVQRRKLIDRDPRLPRLIDKLAVKQVIADTLGNDWVTPTLWAGEVLPVAPLWPAPFVVKSRHGCKHLRIVCSDRDDWAAIRRDSASWMRRPYGRWLDEWGYRDVPRGLLVEPFIGSAPSLPTDYKLYVFHGRVEAVQVHLDRANDHRWMLFDRRWQPMSARSQGDDPVPPTTLPQMIEAAEILGRTFDFVRVDFYDIGAVPRFGELTFYPGSGLDPFDPLELDHALGRHWSRGAGDIVGARIADERAAGELRQSDALVDLRERPRNHQAIDHHKAGRERALGQSRSADDQNVRGPGEHGKPSVPGSRRHEIDGR